jgi:nucleoside-diphosphate-sugar epimerase
MSEVLVTGGSGFVGCHVIVQLLTGGHAVRTTVRSLNREGEVRAMVHEGGASDAALSLYEADLGSDAGWREAVAGCHYVMHVASPIPSVAPKHEDELIVPARERHASRVARSAGRRCSARGCDVILRRGLLRASATGRGVHREGLVEDRRRNERVCEVEGVAERAAWDFMDREGGQLEKTVVNPAGIFGPMLGPDVPSSINVMKRLLDGMPGCPKISFGIVDVRDVADLHVRAMTHPAARGERFIAVDGKSMSMLDIAIVLRARMGALGRKAPQREWPNWLVRLAARRDPAMAPMLQMLGKIREASHEKATRVLGWQPRSNEDTILDTAKSLMKFGALKA